MSAQKKEDSDNGWRLMRYAIIIVSSVVLINFLFMK